MSLAKTRSQYLRSSGFSFIEVMIVVVIIGILAGVVSLSTRHFMDRAKQNRARTDLATFKSALAAFYADYGRYPTSDEGLALLAPKYVEKIHNDPWSHVYQYNQPGRNGPYEVLCLGADGKEGGDGADADISSDDLDATPAAKTAGAP
jgi:general secretion pathway protein G